jgi:hypothetical protein
MSVPSMIRPPFVRPACGCPVGFVSDGLTTGASVMSGITRFLGDSPFRVLVKLIVVSFLVGIVMAFFGWTPRDLVDNVIDFFHSIWNMGFGTVDRFFGYMLLGAVVVVPLFLVMRLFSLRR